MESLRGFRTDFRLMVFTTVALGLLLVPAGSTWAGDAFREGLEAFASGNYDEALRRWEAADAVEPARLDFSRGCALARLGSSRRPDAEAAFEKATRTDDVRLAAKAWLNLGMIAAAKLTERAGPNPEALGENDRKELRDLAALAEKRFRAARELDPSAERPRLSLEQLLETTHAWEKAWKSGNAARRRQSLGVLALLESVAKELTAIRSETRPLIGRPASPARRQAGIELGERQAELREDLIAVSKKLPQYFSSTPAAPGPGDTPPVESPGMGFSSRPEVIELAQKRAEQGLERTRERLGAIAQALSDDRPAEAATALRKAMDELDAINPLLLGLIPLVQQSLEKQKRLHGENPDPQVPGAVADVADNQRRLLPWLTNIGTRSQELLEDIAAAETAGQTADTPPQLLAAAKERLTYAERITPALLSHAKNAADMLQVGNQKAAKQAQQRVITLLEDLLRRFAEPPPPEQSKQDDKKQDKQQQEQKKQPESKQQEKKKENEKQDSAQNKNKSNQPESDQKKSESNKQSRNNKASDKEGEMKDNDPRSEAEKQAADKKKKDLGKENEEKGKDEKERDEKDSAKENEKDQAKAARDAQKKLADESDDKADDSKSQGAQEDEESKESVGQDGGTDGKAGRRMAPSDIEALVRAARDRQREYQKRKLKIERALMEPVRVKKDW